MGVGSVTEDAIRCGAPVANEMREAPMIVEDERAPTLRGSNDVEWTPRKLSVGNIAPPQMCVRGGGAGE